MGPIVNLLFEANLLKSIPRSGFAFLGAGGESVAEHSFTTTFIAFILSRLHPEVDALRLISMCLVHDLPEARIGDLNYVQKKYVTPAEDRAAADMARELPFRGDLIALLEEFAQNRTMEARLAHDADQLSLLVELKRLKDLGYLPPEKWLRVVSGRLQTDSGRNLGDRVMATEQDEWWQAVL